MMQRIIALWRSLPPSFWMLWLGTLINRLGGFIVFFLAIYLTDDRHMPVEVTGVIVGLWGLGGLIGSPIGGWLADRWGRRPTMIVSMVTGTLSLLAMSQAVGPWALGAGALFFGWTTSLYRPAMSAAVADLVAPEKRVRAYGLIYWAANLGFSGASVLGGLLAKAGFFWYLVVDALTLLVFGLIIWVKVPETRPTGPAKVAVAFGNPYGDRLFMGLVGVTFLIATVFCQNLSTLPVEMRRDGISPAHFGALMAINGILIVLLQPVAIKWPVDRRGIYQGAYSVSWTLANAVAPALGGWMMARFGSLGLWGGCLMWGVLAALGSVVLTHRFQHRARELRELTVPS